MTDLHLAFDEVVTTIEAPRARQAEHLLFHPTRGSVISITSSTLQELDLATGALVGETEFDLSAVASIVSSNSSTSNISAPAANDRAHALDHLLAVGSDSVVGVFQSRFVVVWDLQSPVLHSISELEKLSKSMSAVAASLCRDRWLFYASEGSASIKVTAIDSREIPKKISRKAANRNSQITALAYVTTRRVLCCGSSDGIVQFYAFAADNTLGGKDEAALATLLFASLATQSPVVTLAVAVSSSNATYVLVGSQSRAIDVWSLLPNSGPKTRDPQRVAATQFSPQQAVDFAKRSGELALALHPTLPLLIAHWHPFAYTSSSSAIAWTFHPSIGGGSGGGAGANGGLSNWCELVPAVTRTAAHTTKAASEDDSSYCAAGVCWLDSRLVCYRSMPVRSLAVLRVDHSLDATGSSSRSVIHYDPPSLTTRFALDFEQYWSYVDVPTHVVRTRTNPEPLSSEFIVELVSLQTGGSEKVDDLPAWRSDLGKLLSPWTLIANQRQTTVCVKLRDPRKPASDARDGDCSFAYVVLEIVPKAGASLQPQRNDADDSADVVSNYRVACGAQLDARDVCFAEHRADDNDDTRQRSPWVLVVLAPSGKSLVLQTSRDNVESATRILLPRDVLRVFSSPVALTEQSPHRSTVGSRLLLVTLDAANCQVLQLSDDNLSLSPQMSSGSWTTQASDEVIVNVSWNKTSPPSTASSLPSVADASSKCEILAAVLTSTRLVILTEQLQLVRAYDLVRDLDAPQSMLWIAQSLLFVTSANHVRYLTPLRAPRTDNTCERLEAHSRLVCCLAEADRRTAQHTTLLAVCGDRLAFATTDTRTLHTTAFVRPIAICEPLTAGFTTPNATLKAILERDVLVFAMTGGTESPSPLTDYLLTLLHHDFGWRDTTLRLFNVLTGSSNGASSAAATATTSSSGAPSSTFAKTAHLSLPLLASLLLQSHQWRAFLQLFLAHDPGLEEYALAADDDSATSSAKLPSRTGRVAQQFRAFGAMLDAVGQSALALKCFDLAGDDLAIVDMLRGAGDSSSSIGAALQKDWSKLNPPLAALLRAEAPRSASTLVQLDSVVWRRHDLFSLLCCDGLQQNERRSRLLASVKPFDALSTATTALSATMSTSTPLDATACPRARVLPWKRLVPEDAKDWIGVSLTPHFATDDPKNPSFGFGTSSVSSGLGSISATGGAGGMSSDGSALASNSVVATNNSSSSSSDANAKMTIGPFVDDEDAVVAYWRFEEGATLNDSSSSTASPVESLDTSKRENNLQLLGFGTTTSLVVSTAPVDRGEEGRVQEAYALRFPPTASTTATDTANESGARCNVRSGSTLDIGVVFDDDPYRRKLTFEAWVRNFVLARTREQQLQEQQQDDDEIADAPAAMQQQFLDAATRPLVCRRSTSNDADVWFAFALVDGFLVLEFADQTVRSDERVTNAATWHHVAFSIDVQSLKHATVKLFLHGRCVGVKDVTGIDATNTKLYANATATAAAADSSRARSCLHLGSRLCDYEMTEVRVWAAARTQDQLSDMKENYLGIAEAKKRMKIAIHQRNCQCDKCHARRTKAPAAKLALPIAAFPSTPPTGAVRDRRRPAPK